MSDDLGLPLESIASSSFAELLNIRGLTPTWAIPPGSELKAPEGTTILAMRYADGVLMGGDRRATSGHLISHRRMRKVYAADSYSAVAISGTAGLAMELIRLLQTELEHYEKLEGTRLSLEGKANHLSSMVRNQLPLAMQGLVVVPLYCGFDETHQTGKLFSFDVVGGRYEEADYAASGSGGQEAKAYLKGVFDADMDLEAATKAAVGALIAAADEDAATGGPDPRRGIYPNVVTVTTEGYSELAEADVAAAVSDVLAAL